MAHTRPKVLEFDVAVDSERTARSTLGGSVLPADDAWHAEHLALAGAVRCVLTSLDYHARRSGLQATGSGSVHGVVTKRESDGRYAFVEIAERLEVELTPAPDQGDLRELLERAERDCFVGNSLTPRPRYHWVVNGQEVR
jgi:organic hydroperoxide reductase OsmC/OhrA